MKAFVERTSAQPSSSRSVPMSSRSRGRGAPTCDTDGMGKGYAEGPAAEEAERRLEERAAEPGEDAPPERLAVYGSTEQEPERHFLGWLGEVDPDDLFDAGTAYGITVVRARP